MALAFSGGTDSTLLAKIAGEILGDGGFGYDPIFSPGLNGGPTFAQIPIADKNSISHRGLATRLLIDELKTRKLI